MLLRLKILILSVSVSASSDLGAGRSRQLQSKQGGKGCARPTMDCPQLWVFSLSLNLPELSISSGREELRKLSEEEGGKNFDEKLKQGHLLPQVRMSCFFCLFFIKTPPD